MNTAQAFDYVQRTGHHVFAHGFIYTAFACLDTNTDGEVTIWYCGHRDRDSKAKAVVTSPAEALAYLSDCRGQRRGRDKQWEDYSAAWVGMDDAR
jgi:hypothetical protein